MTPDQADALIDLLVMIFVAATAWLLLHGLDWSKIKLRQRR
jgi:hypothetical protein